MPHHGKLTWKTNRRFVTVIGKAFWDIRPVCRHTVRSKSALIFSISVAIGVAAVIALLYSLEGDVPSPKQVWKLGALLPAVRYLLSFVGVFLTYLFAKSFVHVSPTPQNWLGELKLYLICIGACALIALITAIQLGTHTRMRSRYLATVRLSLITRQRQSNEADTVLLSSCVWSFQPPMARMAH
jgi:hypothetical protein